MRGAKLSLAAALGLEMTRTHNSSGALRLRLCWVLAFCWFIVFLSGTLPGSNTAVSQSLQALLLLLFVVLHASLSYGYKGFATYAGIACVVSFVMEATSIQSGFPFGFYTHNVAGLKPLGVPLYVPLVYMTAGWMAWVLSQLITRDQPSEASGAARFTTPLIAAFVLTFFDFPLDPTGATVQGLWTFRHPGGYFGVPLTNFLGWLLTGWLFFQLFALLERRFGSERASTVHSSGYWLLPCLVWAGMAVQFPIKYATSPQGTVSVGARVFVIADVYESSVIAALLTMVFAALVAIMRIWSPAAVAQRDEQRGK